MSAEITSLTKKLRKAWDDVDRLTFQVAELEAELRGRREQGADDISKVLAHREEHRQRFHRIAAAVGADNLELAKRYLDAIPEDERPFFIE